MYVWHLHNDYIKRLCEIKVHQVKQIQLIFFWLPLQSITPPSPAPVVEEVHVNVQSRDPTPEYVPTPTPKIPDLPPVDIPALPEIIEEKKVKLRINSTNVNHSYKIKFP